MANAHVFPSFPKTLTSQNRRTNKLNEQYVPLEKKTSTYRNSDDPENTGTIYLHGDRSTQ